MSTSPIIQKLLAKTQRTDYPNFNPGDTVRVQVKIKEGDKERLQAFEGVVISMSRGLQPSFTVRKIRFVAKRNGNAPGDGRGVSANMLLLMRLHFGPDRPKWRD